MQRLSMLENDNLIEEFKKTISSTIKSIGKSNSIEVNFVQESSSIDGETINLVEPNLNAIKNKLNYIQNINYKNYYSIRTNCRGCSFVAHFIFLRAYPFQTCFGVELFYRRDSLLLTYLFVLEEKC